MRSSKSSSGTSVVLTVALGTFLCSFDTNAVTMALPALQKAFGLTISGVQWVSVAYLLTITASLLTLGRWADMRGAARTYRWGTAGFTAAMFLAGLAPVWPLLVLAIVVQGFGAAMMIASANALVLKAVDPSRRGRALGTVAVAVALATCAGPALGGLLVTVGGWRSLFGAQVPLGIVVLILGVKVFGPDEVHQERQNVTSSVLWATGLTALLWAFTQQRTGAPVLVVLAVVGVLALVGFAWSERRGAALVDWSLFRSRAFGTGLLSAGAAYFAMFLMVFVAPFYLQGLRGLSPAAAGLTMVPLSLGILVGGPLGGRLADRNNSRLLAAGGLVLVIVGNVLFGLSGAVATDVEVTLSFALVGLGFGLYQTPNNSSVLGAVPPGRRGIAGATLSTLRNLGMVLGQATAATVLSSYLGSTDVGTGFSPAWVAAFVPGFQAVSFLACGAATVSLVLVVLRGKGLQPQAGGHVGPVVAETDQSR